MKEFFTDGTLKIVIALMNFIFAIWFLGAVYTGYVMLSGDNSENSFTVNYLIALTHIIGVFVGWIVFNLSVSFFKKAANAIINLEQTLLKNKEELNKMLGRKE